MALTKDAIFAADDLPRAQVDTPEWGGCVYVRSMTGTERHEAIRTIQGETATDAYFVAMCCVDEQGHRLFTPDDAAKLGEKNGRVLARISEAALKFNYIIQDDEAGND